MLAEAPTHEKEPISNGNHEVWGKNQLLSTPKY